MVEFSKEEEAYRRGYCHGFLAAKRSDATEKEIYEWRYGDEETAPPGSFLSKQKLHGLKEIDKHRFFINRLKAEEK